MKIFHRLQIIFLCFLISFITTTNDSWAQVAASQTPPPGAVQVTPEEFKDLKKDEVKPSRGGVNFASGLNGAGGDAAIIIFAIVGTVMLIAWIPYVALLAYRGFKNPVLYQFNFILSTQFMHVEQRDDLNQRRLGEMFSLRFTPLASHEKNEIELQQKRKKSYGLNFEIGYYNFYDQIKATGKKQKYHGPYWLIGPSFIFGNLKVRELKYPIFVKLDLTAGTSFHQEVDLILRGELSLNLPIENGFYIGVGAAGLYLYGREGKGIMNHVGDLSSQLVLTTGYVF